MSSVKISKNNYYVNANEFNVIKHITYSNLKIIESVGQFERIFSLINELSILKLSDCICYNSTHGGFIPISCSKSFDSVYILNVKQEHREKIEQNIHTQNIQNIKFNLDVPTFSDFILFSEKIENVDYNIIEKYNPIILSTLSKKITKQNLYEHIFELSGTNLSLYVPSRLFDKFYQNFHYFLNNEILNYDNLIHLCIMVKNGGTQFESMLQKNLHLIDSWTILDTGSTDGTIDTINKVLVGKKKGNLYQEPFINFRDSRNRLLELAGQDCKYIVMLDDTYVIEGDLRKFLNEVRGDQVATSFTLYIKSDDTIYGSNRIIKSESGLRYVHRIHEVITDKNNVNIVIPKEVSSIDDRRFDYMEKRTMERKQLDLKLLFEEVEENPHDPRAYYYLAQTYNLLEDYEKAFYYFTKRAEFTNSGFVQERVDALFESARVANFKLNKPWHECEELYNKCYKADESRPEAMYFIGIHYYLENNFNKAFGYFKKAFEIGFPIHCQYSLKPTLSYHFLPKFLCKICYDLNEYELGLKAAELFLKNNLPNAESYEEVVSWYKIYEKLTIQIKDYSPKIPEKPIFVFHADGGFNNWSGSSIFTIGVGGSETYIIEMARYIQKSGTFDVYVFCNCLEEENFEGVIYKPLSKYYSFINQNYIHTCIVSRFSEYLPVTFKGFTKNVYMVVHDLTPTGIVIPLDKKLKKIFCLTEWHVEYFTQIFPTLKNITVPFYYGIDFNKFNNDNISLKEQYKFIYSSFPNRGLLQLLQMWPKIYEFQPQSSLHIYCDIDGKWVNQVQGEMMNKIRQLFIEYGVQQNNMNIYYHGWVNKKVLAEAWISSDIWFYPCTFMETFCLTALEAALTKTFVITNDLAALQNTVGDRGVIINGNPLEPEWQETALDEIKKYLEPANKYVKNELIERNFKWASNLSWSSQANKLLEQHILKNSSTNIVSVIEQICSFKLINKNDYHILKIGAFKGNVPNDSVYYNINSNTKAIFVEPVPTYYYELKNNYNNKFINNQFIYLNDAVSDKNEKLQIYYPSKTNNFNQLPSWIEQIASSNIKHCEDHGYQLDYDMININAITVKQIVEVYNIQMLFCLMIDTEGSDFKILMNTDFSKFKPLYIVFENMRLTSYHNRGENYNTLIHYLSQFGYKIIYENEMDTLMTIL